MSDVILVLNAGSSSLKFTLFAVGAEPTVLCGGQISGIGTAPRFDAKSATASETHRWDKETSRDELLRFLLGWVQDRLSGHRLFAAGHRVVHGGDRFAGPVRIDAEVLAELGRLEPLAPLHQPHNLFPISTLAELHPGLPQVACFDTAFHATNPDVARRFAIPAELHDAGVRRYGFHGLSYEYVASALPAHDARAAAGKVVVCHLGNGSSMCAIDAGKSIASTMGFTAVDGLPMGTRAGALDAGVLLYLMDERKMDARAIEKLIYSQSGLLGMSGISSDMRKLLESDDARARIAVDVFVYRIGRELGSLVAALGGLDALVFTAGIGENSAAIRERVCRDAAWTGLVFDAEANAAGKPCISAAPSRISAWVVPTNEELMIARHTQRLLQA
jgi:acetate kinase